MVLSTCTYASKSQWKQNKLNPDINWYYLVKYLFTIEFQLKSEHYIHDNSNPNNVLLRNLIRKSNNPIKNNNVSKYHIVIACIKMDLEW